jgi:hypothetical protein
VVADFRINGWASRENKGGMILKLHQLDSGGSGGLIQITVQCREGQSVTDRQFQVSGIVAGLTVLSRTNWLTGGLH